MKSVLALLITLSLSTGSVFATVIEEWEIRGPKVLLHPEGTEENQDLGSFGVKVFYKLNDTELTVDLVRTLCTTDEPVQRALNFVWSYGCGNHIDLSYANARLIMATLSQTSFPCEKSTKGYDTWGVVGAWLTHYGKTMKVQDIEESTNDMIVYKDLSKSPAALDAKIRDDFKEGFPTVESIVFYSKYKLRWDNSSESGSLITSFRELGIEIEKDSRPLTEKGPASITKTKED